MDSLNRHEDYGQEALDETHLGANPIEQFKIWLREAEAAEIFEPNAFVLGTIDAAGQPTSRTVLLKGLDEEGFFFATNYLSRKGSALETNRKVSAVFGWYSMYRQVLIEGVAHRVPAAESDAYFASRPHDSQVAAWSSHQSAPIENRAALDKQFDDALQKFKGTDVPRPEYWGGYRVVPTRIEFWKGRSNRMHDRIVFERSIAPGQTPGEWHIGRLQP
jgi:pyridoxamine 5'-phosphate oxidase